MSYPVFTLLPRIPFSHHWDKAGYKIRNMYVCSFGICMYNTRIIATKFAKLLSVRATQSLDLTRHGPELDIRDSYDSQFDIT